jgi:hypothetical protein
VLRIIVVGTPARFALWLPSSAGLARYPTRAPEGGATFTRHPIGRAVMSDQKTIYHWPAGEGRICFARPGHLWHQENYPELDGAYWAECSMCRRPGVVVTDQARILDFMPPGTRLSEDGKTLTLEFGQSYGPVT